MAVQPRRVAVARWGILFTVSAGAWHSASTAPGGFQSSSQGSQISGVVVNDELPGRAVSGALVTLSGGGEPGPRTAVTDGRGVFLFGGLSAGRYTIIADRPGSVRMAYGARQFGGPGTPLAVAANSRIAGLSVVLPRGAVITGTVTDSKGRPVRRASVRALRPALRDNLREAVFPVEAQAAGAQVVASADEDGVYRLFGLPPGVYLIEGRAQVTPSGKRQPAVFYPGTLDHRAAGLIALRYGQVMDNIDLSMGDVPVAEVRGRIFTGSRAPAGTEVLLEPGNARNRLTAASAEGEFRFLDVAPGDYTIFARLIWQDNGVTFRHVGQTTISVSGHSVENLAIPLAPSHTIHGRIEVEAKAGSQPTGPLGFRLAFHPIWPWPGEALIAQVTAEGRFTVASVPPGQYRLQLSVINNTTMWSLRAVTIDGQETPDVSIAVSDSTPIGQMVVTVTNQTQHLAGVLRDASGRPRPDLSLLVVSVDRRFWVPRSSRVRLVRPATDGAYEVDNLPAGDYRLLAFGQSEPDDPTDPRLLEPLMGLGVPISLAPGERRLQDIQVAEIHQN